MKSLVNFLAESIKDSKIKEILNRIKKEQQNSYAYPVEFLFGAGKQANICFGKIEIAGKSFALKFKITKNPENIETYRELANFIDSKVTTEGDEKQKYRFISIGIKNQTDLKKILLKIEENPISYVPDEWKEKYNLDNAQIL